MNPRVDHGELDLEMKISRKKRLVTLFKSRLQKNNLQNEDVNTITVLKKFYNGSISFYSDRNFYSTNDSEVDKFKQVSIPMFNKISSQENGEELDDYF